MMQLLAVACVSLASKMEETEVPSCLDLQVNLNCRCFDYVMFGVLVTMMNCDN